MAQLGVDSLQNLPNLDLSITLGAVHVRLLDLTGAYGALANGGNYTPSQLIERVETTHGEVLYTRPTPTPRRVVDERVAFLISDILSDDRARTPGMGAHSVLNIGRVAAAKTGTTTALHDNWVMGYTPDWVVGVWVGNADHSPMVNLTGLSGAGPIWHAVMRFGGRSPYRVLTSFCRLGWCNTPSVARQVC
jgi:membrane peptidoglycan carboxypeptidase